MIIEKEKILQMSENFSKCKRETYNLENTEIKGTWPIFTLQ